MGRAACSCSVTVHAGPGRVKFIVERGLRGALHMRHTFVIGLLLLLLAPVSFAEPPWQKQKNQSTRPAVNETRSLADAIDHVRTSTGGRIIGASQGIDRTGRPVYLVKVLLPNGVVRTMRVPTH